MLLGEHGSVDIYLYTHFTADIKLKYTFSILFLISLIKSI
ncbi:hypothetical protein HMPREF0742_00910 [Rothia aeria F0184]|uniref:Uncharacterized protein n=1 Tax=Rothia aeria F0184 TaxID=888019 RepID=U7V5V7_9MICC|nr:hypothetical protein HMPREF0742_00910 [Rothia aeria F0184]